jgi:Rrf2 family protein
MLKLSKKTEYAIIAILDMAGKQVDEWLTAKDLSQKYNIPREIMGKVLQSLAKQGIIISHQGAKGGYKLKASLEQLNINSIVNAVDGPIHLVDCKNDTDCDCGQLDYCNIKTPMELIHIELNRFFDNITLKDFKEKYAGLIPFGQTHG